MKHIFLDSSRIIYDNKDINLEYYIIEETENAELSNSLYYGAEIKMQITYNSGKTVNEGKRARMLFSNIKDAEDFARLLLRNNVTPTTLYEIAAEYITDFILIETT